MQAENNNDIAITEAKLKDFLSSVLSSEGIVVDIRRTFIEYNGVNRSRVFARHANRMACKGSNEKFVVIALLCYPALQWLLKAQDIDALIEKLKEENEDESVWRMSNIQRILESSMGGCKPQLRLEMRKLFFARCQQLVDEIDEAMNKAVFMNPASKPSRISLAMAMLRGSILDSDPVTAVTIRNNFDSIVEDVTAIAGDVIKPLVMQLAPNEGEAKTAEAAYLYHNTEVLLREYSRIVNPSVADENRSLRILAQGGNTLESDARCHQAQVLVQYAQLIRGAIELVKDFPGDSKLYDVLMFSMELADESDGTRKLMAIAPSIESVLLKGGLLLVDEIEKELHPALVEFIVAKFQSKKTNPNGAQIVFTTYNTDLLSMELLRKDQLYFVDKNKDDGVSELYSISDFSTRTTENVRKGYLLGKYGATPNVEIEEVE